MTKKTKVKWHSCAEEAPPATTPVLVFDRKAQRILIKSYAKDISEGMELGLPNARCRAIWADQDFTNEQAQTFTHWRKLAKFPRSDE